ncbi:hypothetical protein BY996DRAFT_6803241 [Phakopsora pachyrhizi]|nr:hypothetical protein BY996DRAFT_6803241 [Phakopsora pachyrhizi]
MILKLPKILLCLTLWTKCTKGSEEAIDFLASFPGQTKTSNRVPNVYEPIVQTETLEKNWLSLGRSNSNGGSDERLKEAIESNEHPLTVLGMSSDLGTNEIIRLPIYRIPQVSGHARLKAPAMAATQFGAQSSKTFNALYNNPELLSKHSPQHQPFVSLIKPSCTVNASKNKAHVTEIDLRHLELQNNEHGLVSGRSEMVFKKRKSNNGQSFKDESSKEMLNKKEIIYTNKHNILVANRWDGRKTKMLIKPEQKVKFQNELMALLEPESPMIKLDFIKRCIESIKELKNGMRDSMLDNLACIKRQINKHGGEDFYITDSEVNDFSKKPSGVSYKIKSSSISNPKKPKEIYYCFLKNFKEMVEPINFENLINQFVGVDELNPSVTMNPEQWHAFNEEKNLTLRLWKKMYIGKVFLMYSIMINKIFSNGPKNNDFITQQRAAIEFYNSVCGTADPDERGNFFMKTDILLPLVKSPEERLTLENLSLNFDNNLKYKKNKFPNSERTLFANAMILIEIWLSMCRVGLHNKIYLEKNSKYFLKPFMNSIFEILLQISLQSY